MPQSTYMNSFAHIRIWQYCVHAPSVVAPAGQSNCWPMLDSAGCGGRA